MSRVYVMKINQWLRYLLTVALATMVMITIDASMFTVHVKTAIAANIENLDIPSITVYRSPACSCCGNWIEHMQKHGFKIQADIKTEHVEEIKQKYHLPENLASCHTAIINSYVMEGHIPADDIKLFMQQQPQLAGLAVPGMTVGTPGMELGNEKQPFSVMTFNHQGEVKLFKQYQSY